jgi:hypothetical protein
VKTRYSRLVFNKLAVTNPELASALVPLVGIEPALLAELGTRLSLRVSV